ncbi:MAG: hypothetical protein, partial [Olavius algarvensis Gamma 3 endosymbiont]
VCRDWKFARLPAPVIRRPTARDFYRGGGTRGVGRILSANL